MMMMMIYPTEHSPYWEDNSRSDARDIPYSFMEPSSSLLCSQESTTELYLEPVESSPHRHALFIWHPF